MTTVFRASAPITRTWEHFDLDVKDGIATVSLNRPQRLNALTFQSYADLRDLLAEVPHRSDIRAVVITGRGRGFCSGGDVDDIIGQLQHMKPADRLEFTRMTGAVVRGLRDCPVPIIAAVNGVAAGAGAVVALAADVRLVARTGSFQFLFTQVGLAGADMGAGYLLQRFVGLGRTSELLLLGKRIDADRALEYGLATEVVEDDRLAERAHELAQEFVEGPTLAYRYTKMLLSRESDMDLNSAVELDAATQALLMESEDHREFYAAFQGRRRPHWRGQ